MNLGTTTAPLRCHLSLAQHEPQRLLANESKLLSARRAELPLVGGTRSSEYENDLDRSPLP